VSHLLAASISPVRRDFKPSILQHAIFDCFSSTSSIECQLRFKCVKESEATSIT
jgi:hypothetical protein